MPVKGVSIINGASIVNGVSITSVAYFDFGVKFVSNRWIPLSYPCKHCSHGQHCPLVNGISIVNGVLITLVAYLDFSVKFVSNRWIPLSYPCKRGSHRQHCPHILSSSWAWRLAVSIYLQVFLKTFNQKIQFFKTGLLNF